MDVILDVDTGVDDALALLLAAKSPVLNLLGVTCVMGNVEIDKVVHNTLRVLALAGAGDVPVARGMGKPLVEKEYNAKGVHADDGLGGIPLPDPANEPVPEHAVEFLRRNLMLSPKPITLIPLAPLTNIAVLLAQHPEVKEKIKQLIIMGGAFDIGNASAVAEFNIRQDPEAADIVFRSGLPIVMYGLEVFRQVKFTREEATELTSTGQATAKFAGQILLFMMDNFGREEASIGDAGAVASAIAPGGLTTETHPVRVELDGTWTRGQTVVDRRPPISRQRESQWQPRMEHDVSVAVDVDVERYRQIFKHAVML